MKSNAKMGLGRTVKKAEALDWIQVKQLWESGVLGDDEPKKLCKTLLFLLGVNLALRAGWEYKALRHPGCDSQIVIVEEDGVECLLYTDDLSTKTNQGGLKHQQLEAKSVLVFPCNDQSKCLVYYYKKYISMLPKSLKYQELYLQENSKKRIALGESCFKDRPIGINTLGSTMKELAKNANLVGFFTNHSLRASSATVMYNHEANFPEQLIAETTCHRSNAIRSYKRTKRGLKRKVSNVLTDLTSGVPPQSVSNVTEQDGPIDLSAKKAKLEPFKHEYLKKLQETCVKSNVQNVKLDITVSDKENFFCE